MSTPSWLRPPERRSPYESPNQHFGCTGNASSVTATGAGAGVGAGVGVGCGVGAGEGAGAGVTGAANASAVAWSTTPVAGRPLAVWNAFTAVVVAEPKIPSAPPRTEMPAAISARWRSATAGERSPSFGSVTPGAGAGAGAGAG